MNYLEIISNCNSHFLKFEDLYIYYYNYNYLYYQLYYNNSYYYSDYDNFLDFCHYTTSQTLCVSTSIKRATESPPLPYTLKMTFELRRLES